MLPLRSGPTADQRYHEHLQVASSATSTGGDGICTAPQRRPLETPGDIDDPGPWLEAYAAGVAGSPLEPGNFFVCLSNTGFDPRNGVPISNVRWMGARLRSLILLCRPGRLARSMLAGAAFHVGSKSTAGSEYSAGATELPERQTHSMVRGRDWCVHET